MVLDIGISDMLSIAQTIGIIGSLLIALFFSRREIRELSVDTETKVLSDLDRLLDSSNLQNITRLIKYR